MADDKTLRITLVRSTIGEKPKTRACVRTPRAAQDPPHRGAPGQPGSARADRPRSAHLVEVEEA